MEALATMTRLEGGRFQDENGMILPWYTSPCLEWLLTLDLKSKRIFEYGVGDSTLYYKYRGAEVYGVDNSYIWADIGNSQFITNEVNYPLAIYGHGDFDIVVIDGICRDDCTSHALINLKQGGYLIIDNYHQPSVETNWPLTDVLIEGMPITIYKESNHYDWQTAVITKL